MSHKILESIAHRLDNLGLGAEPDDDGVRAYGRPADWLPLLAKLEAADEMYAALEGLLEEMEYVIVHDPDMCNEKSYERVAAAKTAMTKARPL